MRYRYSCFSRIRTSSASRTWVTIGDLGRGSSRTLARGAEMIPRLPPLACGSWAVAAAGSRAAARRSMISRFRIGFRRDHVPGEQDGVTGKKEVRQKSPDVEWPERESSLSLCFLHKKWCRRGDSNPHGLPHTPLKRACLPIPPLRHLLKNMTRPVRAIAAIPGRGYYFFTGASHAVCFLSLPWTISKNAACSFWVMGPGLPDPIFRLSTSRIGVISAAVPVKNASSAI